jgi:hypothetical protein
MAHGTRDVLLDFNMPVVTSGTTYTEAADQASTDVIDLASAIAQIGTGEPIYCKILCTGAVTQTGTAVFSLQQSSDNAVADAYADILTSATFTNGAGLTAGAVILDAAVPKDTERYLRIWAAVGTGNITAGAFKAFLYTR